MKLGLFIRLTLFAPLTLLTSLACSATVVTFDDLSAGASGSLITNGYRSLSWSNFWCENAILFTSIHGSNGYLNGMVSPSNVAYNANGNSAEIDSRGTNFEFLGAYLTGAFNSNLSIEVRGFRGAAVLYDTTVIASATNATLFTFDYLDIDRLQFNAFGGQDAGFPAGDGVGGTWFAMDNFTFEFIPEPSSLLLTVGGALLLWPLLKRRRA